MHRQSDISFIRTGGRNWVDDVAARKGRTYATAVYDKSNGGRLLALLEGRDGTELRKWLQEHPQIKRVARDCAGAYAKVLSEVLPDCVQVAGRYHLFANLSDHLRKFMKSELPDEVYVEDGRIVGKEKSHRQDTGKNVSTPVICTTILPHLLIPMAPQS